MEHPDSEVRRPNLTAPTSRPPGRSPHRAVKTIGGSGLSHLAEFPIRRVPLAPLLDRMWELRNNVTPYDAAYVAQAERLNAQLITCDTKLANSTGIRCAVDLIT